MKKQNKHNNKTAKHKPNETKTKPKTNPQN